MLFKKKKGNEVKIFFFFLKISFLFLMKLAWYTNMALLKSFRVTQNSKEGNRPFMASYDKGYFLQFEDKFDNLRVLFSVK